MTLISLIANPIGATVPMQLDEYRKEFLEDIRARASSAANFTHTEFVEVCAELLSDAEEISDFQSCYFRGSGSRNKSLAVDGFSQDDVDGSLRLIVADFSGSEDLQSLNQSQARALFGKLTAFCEDAFSGRLLDEVDESSPAHSLALTLKQQRKQITRLRLYLITDVALSLRVRDWPEGDLGGIPTEFHIWDINRFHQLSESTSGRDELTVDFTQVVPGGLPCLAASVDAANYRAFLCVIPGSVLAEIYQQFGSRLLEGNVRSYLGTRGRINKLIRKTVTSEPTMFFAYNNGISATTTKAVVVPCSDGLRLTEVTDLQIVNGGQTTATLASALADKESGLSRTFVQMKLSEVTAETSGTYTPLIARYANSQTTVSAADFYSNHEFHQRMEQISRTLRAPALGGAQYGTHWRYERARGTYANEHSRLTVAQKASFLLQNPKTQLITKVDLAKFENAWRFLPNIVSQGAQKNFVSFSNYVQSEWDRNQDQFNEEYYKRVVVKAMLFKKAEDLVSKQPWYQNGYRANIVAYTIAKFAHLIQFEGTGELFDFKACWIRQGLGSGIESQLVTIAAGVFEVIVNPESGFQNVTEWAKKEICWTRVQELRIPLEKDLAQQLVGRDDDRAIKKEAAASQTLLNGIQSQMAVVELGSRFWEELLSWSKARMLLTPDEQSIVAVACSMPRKTPTEKQSARLIQIKDRVELEGFELS
jgi:AIPR protein